ncbi:MAG: NAD(P)-dependent oxidoreductase [Bacteroidetes bacterium]|nr:NAD(P)-dependent oxidoreductase [Bacteroidota bacterium]MBS1930857.1 NAD(P)-dependent oxidoreductase [Bacteroidota bacterium]
MSKKKKIYMAGVGGMLGEAFYKTFKNAYELKCTDIDVNEKWLKYLDFRNFEDYRKDVKKFKPDYLFHIGAFTDLEYCETHPDETYLTNTISVENAVCIANELELPLLYISTAGIFDGGKDTYDDWDIPNPLGHYARSKYAGELFVTQNCIRYLVCRAGWMMGGGPAKDKKFVQKIMQQIKNGKKELFIVDDKLGTPTYTHDFAKNVKLLLEKEYWGLYNMVCEGITSRLDVAKELVKILKLDKEVKVTPVPSDYFKETYFAARPPSERLIDKKLELRNVNIMRDWKVCLEEYLKGYYQNYLKNK